MALVTPIPAMSERAGSMRFHGITTTSPGSRSSRSSVTEEPVSRLIEEKIFVAVDKHVAKSKCTLVWALQNTGGKKICVVHVHQPSQMIPVSKYSPKPFCLWIQRLSLCNVFFFVEPFPSGSQVSSEFCEGGRSQGFPGKGKGESAYDSRRVPPYMPPERGMYCYCFSTFDVNDKESSFVSLALPLGTIFAL